jgi:hypothetical protein
MKTCSALALALFSAAAGAAQDAPRAAIAAWDTGQPSAEAVALAARAGWTAIPSGQTPSSFKGDAVISSGRITAVVRKQGTGIEVYSGDQPRARLVLAGDAKPGKIALVENGRNGACLEVAYGGAAAKFRLRRDDIAVEVEPGSGAKQVRVECPSRFVVLPDFFADDMLVDAAKIPRATADLPSENFVIHPLGRGEALAMVVFENREQDVRATLSGEGASRVFTGSEIEFGKGPKNKVWLALLGAPGIWHSAEIKESDTGAILPLDWKMPFPAQWRVDFTRTDDLTHSWEMLLQEKANGPYLKPVWLTQGFDPVPATRKRWAGSMLYTVTYPCWSDPEGMGFLQPLKHNAVKYRGPAVLYPAMKASGKTPDGAVTVVDVVRLTLGVGPCEYILDVEGQKSLRKGRATCSVRDELKMIYEAKRQKQSRKEIEGFLDQGIEFVKHTRVRIDAYLEYARWVAGFLAAKKKASPELSDAIGALEKILGQIDGQVQDRKEKMQTPERAVQITDEFRKTMLDYEGPDVMERLKKYSDELTEIGGCQDDLVARLRWMVKNIRERAGLLMAQDAKFGPVAEEIRAKAQACLRAPVVHEGARQ